MTSDHEKTILPARRLHKNYPSAPQQRLLIVLFASVASLCLSACRSAYIETSLRNDGAAPIRLIEGDYPSASFGTQAIAAHAIYHYRFKVQGSGAVTLSFTGADGKSHSATGPALEEGQHGALDIAVD